MGMHVLLPLVLGTFVVFQPALNRRIGEARGLATATLVNAAVLVVLASLLWLVLAHWGERAPAWLRPRPSPFLWWHLLPGALGLTLVVLVPVAYRSAGALVTAVWMLAGQMATALVWDALSDGQRPTAARVAGAALAIGGALLSARG